MLESIGSAYDQLQEVNFSDDLLSKLTSSGVITQEEHTLVLENTWEEELNDSRCH
eukprot:m.215844 g.215844  ORF g.215844 m.215844 type:complete len:55 (+) comp39843_c1_seq5:1188-1352(+)